MDKWHGLRHDFTPEHAAEKARALQQCIDEMIDRLESDLRSSVRCGEESLRGFSEASLSINLSRTLFDFAR